MKAYISISYAGRLSLSSIVYAIEQCLLLNNIQSFVFVDQYNFALEDEKKMMAQAMSDIKSCDILIAEVTKKGIGIGIEVGYAKAMGKPVFYLRDAEAEHSTTVSGISDYRVIYVDENDLVAKLDDKLKEFLSKV